VTELLERAFAVLDSASPFHEHGLVADALIASADEATLEALDRATSLGEPFDAFVKEAEEIGSSAFVALNLVTAYSMRRRGEPATLRRAGIP
jgi:hypothetical protein